MAPYSVFFSNGRFLTRQNLFQGSRLSLGQICSRLYLLFYSFKDQLLELPVIPVL